MLTARHRAVRTRPARATTPTRTPLASARTASARSIRCGRPTASLRRCALDPLPLDRAALAHRSSQPLRSCAEQTYDPRPHARTKVHAHRRLRRPGPLPRRTRYHSQARTIAQPPTLPPPTCRQPSAAAHLLSPQPPPPHSQVESTFPSRRSGKFSASKRETTSWLVVRRPTPASLRLPPTLSPRPNADAPQP